MNRLVECVPNFSEGRRIEVIDAIVNALISAPNVYLLGREMDADHNRAVITIVGPPESMTDAVLRAVEVAVERIDLTKHAGEHPRIGIGHGLGRADNRNNGAIVGPPESMTDAVLRAVEVAVERIDLTKHAGEHPRIGAA